MMNNNDNDKILQLFEEGVKAHNKGDQPIIKNHNGRDCFILDIPEDIKVKCKTNFALEDTEVILMVRDTSAWNNRKTGLIITTKRIIYIPDDSDSARNRYVISLNSFIRVTYDAKSLLFWKTEETFFAIPAKYFFKSRTKSYDVDRATLNLGRLLQKLRNQLWGGNSVSLDFPVTA